MKPVFSEGGAGIFSPASGVRVVLASGSPRRRQFLEEWGLPFTVRPAESEPAPLPEESPEHLVLRSARAKLVSSGHCPGELVIAADTVVACSGAVLGKPADDEQALEMLLGLSGREHSVITGVALAFPDGTETAFTDMSRVRFHDWDRAVLKSYVRTGECRDKAGAYAIQGRGAFLVASVEGSWSTVVGLPASRLAEILLEGGWIVPAL